MTITEEIIRDLLPLYAAGECSDDSRRLVDEYLKSHPALAREAQKMAEPMPSKRVPVELQETDEVIALTTTRRRLRHHSYLMALGIFFCLAPFAFVYTEGKFYWVIGESPGTAIAYFVIGMGFWVAYLITKYKTRDL